jgi:XTP/dITP diphosphohydrolase
MEHIVLYCILGDETGDFDVADVCIGQCKKLMFRHPFIDWTGWPDDPKADMADKPENAEGVEMTWEQMKQKEKDGNKTVLSGVPAALPSLIKAYRIQDKARNVGFDWKDKADVWMKVREELDELEVELKKEDQDKSTRELGDFLFSVINAARLYHLNPDNALEHTNEKFISRFGYVEQKLKEKHKDFKDSSLKEMDELWNEAKKQEKDNLK